MKIFVKSLNGLKNEVNVSDGMTVKHVKTQLVEKNGVPSEQFRILFKGKIIDDNQKLEDLKLVDGTTLHMITLLRGG